jgi:hypothetical protein
MDTITITLDAQERNALTQLIDVALRQAGIGALDVATHFKAKLDAAVAALVVPEAEPEAE